MHIVGVSEVTLPSNDQKKKYNAEQGKVKRFIPDAVRDHGVSHLHGKYIAREMWEALSSLYQASSKKWKMYLEQKLQWTLM